MFIANLQANPSSDPSQDWIWSRCHTRENAWIRYPQKYKGANPPIVAEPPPKGSPIYFADYNDPEGFCSSDNGELVQALGLRGCKY